jgi:hypothetical protein
MSAEHDAANWSAREGRAARIRTKHAKPGQVLPDQELFKGGAAAATPAGAVT